MGGVCTQRRIVTWQIVTTSFLSKRWGSRTLLTVVYNAVALGLASLVSQSVCDFGSSGDYSSFSRGLLPLIECAGIYIAPLIPISTQAML